jgi:hypothetical protein
MATHDRDRLRDAFEHLRKRGFWARADQDGGMRAIPEDVIKRDGSFVLWHASQTGTAFDDFGDVFRPLYLHHRYRDASDVATVLRAHGLRVRIDGTQNEGIVVVEPQAEE